MFQKIAKHRANDASNDVHRPPLIGTAASTVPGKANLRPCIVDIDLRGQSVGVQDVLNVLFVLLASCLASLLVQTHKRLGTP